MDLEGGGWIAALVTWEKGPGTKQPVPPELGSGLQKVGQR